MIGLYELIGSPEELSAEKLTKIIQENSFSELDRETHRLAQGTGILGRVFSNLRQPGKSRSLQEPLKRIKKCLRPGKWGEVAGYGLWTPASK